MDSTGDPTRPRLPMITNRCINLTTTVDKRFHAPSQFVWVLRPNIQTDRLMPNDAYQIKPMSLTHFHLARFISIRDFESEGIPYVIWLFPRDNTLFSRILAYLTTDGNIKAIFNETTSRKRATLLNRMSPVFVEKHNGAFLGRWIHNICTRQFRVTGLLVQMFGFVQVSFCFL